MANVYVETRSNGRDIFSSDGSRGWVQESAPEIVVTLSGLTAEESERCIEFFQALTRGGALAVSSDAEPDPLVNGVRELIF